MLRMLTVLINAYAVSPTKGSEPGMGWNWITRLAQYCKLHVITEGEWQKDIEAACSKLPQAQNITFHFILVSDKVRQMANNQGDWRFYWYYRKWQQEAYAKALEIIENEHIDVIHQLNMVGFREPGYLWKVKNIPYVWGPFGGTVWLPSSYIKEAPILSKCFFRVKGIISFLQAVFSPRVRSGIKRADVLVTAVPSTQEIVRRFYGRESTYIAETGTDSIVKNDESSKRPGFNLVWSGKFDYCKMLRLALRIMHRLKDYKEIKLHVYGDGNDEQNAFYSKMAEELSLQDSVVWHGRVPHDQMVQEMSTHHLMLFTSISEATSTVLMEAIQNKLPVICFDTCGMGAVVNDSIGAKIKLTTPKQSVEDFASAILYHYQHPDVLKRKAEACGNKIAELSWDSKATKMVELYHEAISNFKQKNSAKS